MNKSNYFTLVGNGPFHSDYSTRREDFYRAVVTKDGKDGPQYCMIFWKHNFVKEVSK